MTAATSTVTSGASRPAAAERDRRLVRQRAEVVEADDAQHPRPRGPERRAADYLEGSELLLGGSVDSLELLSAGMGVSRRLSNGARPAGRHFMPREAHNPTIRANSRARLEFRLRLIRARLRPNSPPTSTRLFNHVTGVREENAVSMMKCDANSTCYLPGRRPRDDHALQCSDQSNQSGLHSVPHRPVEVDGRADLGG